MTTRRTLVLLVLAVAAALLGARAAVAETPRATDLLRADKLAEQASRRLRLPARRAPGWQRGGTGWDTDTGPPSTSGGSVTIRVQPPRRRPKQD